MCCSDKLFIRNNKACCEFVSNWIQQLEVKMARREMENVKVEYEQRIQQPVERRLHPRRRTGR